MKAGGLTFSAPGSPPTQQILTRKLLATRDAADTPPSLHAEERSAGLHSGTQGAEDWLHGAHPEARPQGLLQGQRSAADRKTHPQRCCAPALASCELSRRQRQDGQQACAPTLRRPWSCDGDDEDAAFVAGRVLPIRSRPGRLERGILVVKHTDATAHVCAGGFTAQKEKAPDYVVPDLTGFKLKPYVAYQQAPKS